MSGAALEYTLYISVASTCIFDDGHYKIYLYQVIIQMFTAYPFYEAY